jgi:integral membrane protein
MIIAYRVIGFLEGLSYILLLFVGVPLKYIADNDSWVKALGMPHGLLFVGYIFFTIVMHSKQNLTGITTFKLMLASILPFGTFYTDHKIVSKWLT